MGDGQFAERLADRAGASAVPRCQLVEDGLVVVIEAHGGGGTDFRPVFQMIEDEGIVPEIVIFLTDCYGNFPDDEPPYPTIWASIIDPAHLGYYLPPFGDVIFVDTE